MASKMAMFLPFSPTVPPLVLATTIAELGGILVQQEAGNTAIHVVGQLKIPGCRAKGDSIESAIRFPTRVIIQRDIEIQLFGEVMSIARSLPR